MAKRKRTPNDKSGQSKEAKQPINLSAATAVDQDDYWPTLKLRGEITRKKALGLVALIGVMRDSDPSRPIILDIDSPGGDLDATLRVVDAMQEAGRVYTDRKSVV